MGLRSFILSKVTPSSLEFYTSYLNAILLRSNPNFSGTYLYQKRAHSKCLPVNKMTISALNISLLWEARTAWNVIYEA